jgi:hypothetical protein
MYPYESTIKWGRLEARIGSTIVTQNFGGEPLGMPNWKTAILGLNRDGVQ